MKREQSTQSDALSAFQKIGEAVLRGDALADMAQLLIDEVQRTIGAQTGIVFRRTAPDTINILAHRDKGSSGADSAASMLTLVTPLLNSERRTRVGDLPYAELDEQESHLRSYMEVPLVAASGTVVGAICFADTRPGVFSDEHRLFLNSLAPWIANTMAGPSTTQSETLDSSSEWIGSVAHDLRNPLQLICIVSELLTVSLDASQQSLMSKLNQATASMETLIIQLEDVLSVQKGSLQLENFEADLTPLVRRAVEAVQALATSTGVELRGPQQEDRTPLTMDSARMEQALRVFLDRVVMAAPGSAIEVNIRDTEDAVHLEFEVQTLAAVPTALSSFLTRSHDLELTIAFGIIRLHGGQMGTTLGGTDMLTMSLSWPHK